MENVIIVAIVAIVAELVIKLRNKNVEIVQKDAIVDVVKLCIFLYLK